VENKKCRRKSGIFILIEVWDRLLNFSFIIQILTNLILNIFILEGLAQASASGFCLYKSPGPKYTSSLLDPASLKFVRTPYVIFKEMTYSTHG
jgi:hypothetical protein